MTAATRDMVRDRVAALSRPHLANADDLCAWLDDLAPALYGNVVDLVLRVPARQKVAPAPRLAYPEASIGAACGLTHG